MKKLLFLIAITVLAMALISIANADVPSLAVSPSNSHIIHVTGVGFNASQTVKLTLYNGTESVYNFTEAITTDGATGDLGNFTAIVIVPTILNGTYNLTASTSTVSKTISLAFPDMKGPQGIAGVNGTGIQGETGEQGIQGEQGPQGVAGEDAPEWVLMLAAISLVVSIVAFVLVLVLFKVSK